MYGTCATRLPVEVQCNSMGHTVQPAFLHSFNSSLQNATQYILIVTEFNIKFPQVVILRSFTSSKLHVHQILMKWPGNNFRTVLVWNAGEGISKKRSMHIEDNEWWSQRKAVVNTLNGPRSATQGPTQRTVLHPSIYTQFCTTFDLSMASL